MASGNDRKQYTAKKISSAFLELLTEKPFMNITVTELVERAQVGRATFYRNFNTTRDVLDYAVDEIVSDLVEIGTPILHSDDERDWRDFLFRYIYFLNRSKDNILKIRTENVFVFLNSFSEQMHDYRNSIPPKSTGEKYDISAKLAVVNAILVSWSENGKKESVDEIVEYILSIITRF